MIARIGRRFIFWTMAKADQKKADQPYCISGHLECLSSYCLCVNNRRFRKFFMQARMDMYEKMYPMG